MLLRCLEKVRCLKTYSLNLLSRTCKMKVLPHTLHLCIEAKESKTEFLFKGCGAEQILAIMQILWLFLEKPQPPVSQRAFATCWG